MTWQQELKSGVAALNLDLPPSSLEKLEKYLILLNKWNKVYNLTAIRDIHQMVSHHILDSLVILPHLWLGKWLDVGTGAGLPGLVMAICKPNWDITLIDSNSKKTSFVQQVIIELELKNAKVICGRVEKDLTGNKFDGIVSRAFADIRDFVTLTQGLLEKNGKWAAMKGSPDAEIEALPKNVEVIKQIPLNVENLNAARSLVILKEI